MKVDLSRDEMRVVLMILDEFPLKGLANQAAAVRTASKLSVALNTTVASDGSEKSEGPQQEKPTEKPEEKTKK